MSTTYKLLFLLHITSIVVAFAPAAVDTMLTRQLGDSDSAVVRRVAEVASINSQRIHGTALILAGLFGIGLILASEDAWEFSQTWVSLAFLVWIAMNGVVHGIIAPSERKLAAGDMTARSRLDMGGGLVTVLFFVMLYLMIWKPGV